MVGALIVSAIIIGLFAYFKYHNGQRGRSSRNNASGSYGFQESHISQRISSTTASRSTTYDREHSVIIPDNIIRSSDVNQPPRYDDVVLNDLSGKGNFPEVKPSVPETPPPQYNDHNTTKY